MSAVRLWDKDHYAANNVAVGDEMNKQLDVALASLMTVVRPKDMYAYLLRYGAMTSADVARCKREGVDDDQVVAIVAFIRREAPWKKHALLKSLADTQQAEKIDLVLGPGRRFDYTQDPLDKPVAARVSEVPAANVHVSKSTAKPIWMTEKERGRFLDQYLAGMMEKLRPHMGPALLTSLLCGGAITRADKILIQNETNIDGQLDKLLAIIDDEEKFGEFHKVLQERGDKFLEAMLNDFLSSQGH